MTLFDETDLGGFLRKEVTPTAAAAAEKVVWGWLKPILGVTDRPDPVPAEVFSWAIELGAIAHENPSGLSSRQLGPWQVAYSAERRSEILAEAAAGGKALATPPRPRGNFPPAQRWPDPLC